MPKPKKTSTKPKKSVERIARFVKPLRDWHADARIFKAEPPLEGFEEIIVIAAKTPIDLEMMIWGLNGDKYKYGLIKSYHTHEKDHRGALSRAGYTMVGDVVRNPRPKN